MHIYDLYYLWNSERQESNCTKTIRKYILTRKEQHLSGKKVLLGENLIPVRFRNLENTFTIYNKNIIIFFWSSWERFKNCLNLSTL